MATWAAPVVRMDEAAARVAWSSVPGAAGYTVREFPTADPSAVTFIPKGAQDRSHPARPGFSYTVEARGKRSPAVEMVKGPAPENARVPEFLLNGQPITGEVPVGTLLAPDVGSWRNLKPGSTAVIEVYNRNADGTLSHRGREVVEVPPAAYV